HPSAVPPLSLHDALPIFSPDGTHVLYVAGAESQLMVRAIDQLDAAPMRGIAGVAFPFTSPDGRWVGYATGAGGEIKKVSMTGGRSEEHTSELQSPCNLVC